jgi:hypothetical protein
MQRNGCGKGKEVLANGFAEPDFMNAITTGNRSNRIRPIEALFIGIVFL